MWADDERFVMRRDGPLMCGRCEVTGLCKRMLSVGPVGGIDRSPATLSLRLSEITDAGVRHLLFRMTRNDCAQGPILDTLPITFVREGKRGTERSPLHGPQALAIEKRILNGKSATVTPYCTELETETLAAWSILRMMEIQQAPHDARGVYLHTNFKTDRQPNSGPRESSEEAILVPSCLKKLLSEQKSTRPDFPLTYAEFQSRLASVKAHAKGQTKVFSSTPGMSSAYV